MRQDWTTQRRGDDRMDMDRMERMQQRDMGRMREEDRRTTGRNWRRDEDDIDRRSRWGDLAERRYYDEDRPRRRVKTCIEYENGDEFCQYRD